MEKIQDKAKKTKDKLLKAYKLSLGNVSKATEACNVSRSLFYKYYADDTEFKENVDEIDEANLDFAESMLLKNIRDGKETSLIFYLKTKGKERGYVERQEQLIDTGSFEEFMKGVPSNPDHERN